MKRCLSDFKLKSGAVYGVSCFDVNYDVLRDTFLHGETHADTRLFMIHYVKYQSDGRSYHSKDRYIFGKRAATEHFEAVFQWLHGMYCKDIIKDYTIGMRQIY